MQHRTRVFALLVLLALPFVPAGCKVLDSATPPPESTGVERPQGEPVFQDEGWQDYLDLDNDSNVVSYHCGEDYIEVKFATGPVYKYTYASAGEQNVENMKALADAGDGLNAYINTNAKYLYEGYVPPIECGACSGAGSVTCLVCQGKGSTYCSMCDGSGLNACLVCGGAGGRQCTFCDGTGTQQCFGCRGARFERCYMCGGDGSDYFGDTCAYCGGSGARTCSICLGRGGQTCSYCGADGFDDCSACVGTGAIACMGCAGSPENPCYVCDRTGRVKCSTCDGAGELTPESPL